LWRFSYWATAHARTIIALDLSAQVQPRKRETNAIDDV